MVEVPKGSGVVCLEFDVVCDAADVSVGYINKKRRRMVKQKIILFQDKMDGKLYIKYCRMKA